MNNQYTRSEEQYTSDPGPFLARVVSHDKSKYMGTLQVELINNVGRDQESTGSTIQVRYLSPFYGVTGVRHLTENDDYNGTQKSYGMWMVPPDVGSLVMVIFVNGNASQGFWIGCVQDDYMNFMVPGLAATETHTSPDGKKKVVGEFNKRKNKLEQADQTLVPKPVHPFQKVLEKQGLDVDDIRGLTSSSARREAPSAVFGISTPGPVDTKPGAPTGIIGKAESRIQDAFVSRLGGTTFVMDDGDAAFLRKTHASKGPPEYASVENRESGGQPDIPHNELVRIRTRTGHQILLHNSEDLIYIGNASGTTWIELTSMGKIDIYANDSISIHTQQDLNIKADRDINMEAGRNVNIKAGANHYTEVGATQTLIVGADQKIAITGSKAETVGAGAKTKVTGNYELFTSASNKITGTTSNEIYSAGNNYLTATDTDILSSGEVTITGAPIKLNSGAAAPATQAVPPLNLPEKLSTIAARVPMHEPWDGHENLHIKKSDTAPAPATAGYTPKYTTSTDTFKKISK